MSFRALALTCLLGSTVPAAVQGQGTCVAQNVLPALRTCSVTVGTTSPLVLPRLGQLTVSTNSVSLTAPTFGDFDVQYLNESTPVTVTVNANVAWDLRLRNNQGGGSGFWTGVSLPGAGIPAAVAKPSTELLAGTTFGGPYQAIPTSQAASVALLGAQPAVGGRIVSIYLRSVWTYTFDTPGTYSLLTALSLVLN